MQVQYQHIGPCAARIAHDLKQLLAGLGELDFPTQCAGHRNQAPGSIAMGIGDDDSQAAGAVCDVRVMHYLQGQLDPEGAALGKSAGDADFPAHQLNKPTCNRQA